MSHAACYTFREARSRSSFRALIWSISGIARVCGRDQRRNACRRMNCEPRTATRRESRAVPPEPYRTWYSHICKSSSPACLGRQGSKCTYRRTVLPPRRSPTWITGFRRSFLSWPKYVQHVYTHMLCFRRYYLLAVAYHFQLRFSDGRA